MKKMIIAAAVAATCVSAQASEFNFFNDTHLLELVQGSALSNQANQLRSGSFEMADGRGQSFDAWYKPKKGWQDARVTFITQVSKDTGIIWGFSTGERGPKYTIAPSVKLGFLTMHELNKSTVVSMRATHIFGGHLREKSCQADYGEIGGVQEVNCRLAATELPPAETLQYLIHQKPQNVNMVTVDIRVSF